MGSKQSYVCFFVSKLWMENTTGILLSLSAGGGKGKFKTLNL